MSEADATLVSMPPAGVDDVGPSTLGRYRVEHELGAGGMGVVYKAYDPELRRALAIKVVRTSEPDDLLDRRTRLLHEAATMAALAHRNVCQVFDVGTHDGQLWVAMELIDGVTMRAWLRTPRSREAVLQVVAQICDGLHAAHTVGICHRDVKPDNVIVEPGGRAVLCDFGLSRRDDATRTTTVLAGTLAYMAPELLDGGAPNARTDQYAVAVLVHEALTGTRPRYGVASTALPAPLRAAIARALAADAGERFASVAEFAHALTAPAPVDAPPRRRRGLAIAAAVVAVVGLAVAAGVWLWPRAGASPAPVASAPVPPPPAIPAFVAPPPVAAAEVPAAAAPPPDPACDAIEARARKANHPLALGFAARCRGGDLTPEGIACLSAARTEAAIDHCAEEFLSLADMLAIGWSELEGALHEARGEGRRRRAGSGSATP